MGGSREEDRLGRITWDAANPAGGILPIQLVGMMGYGAGMRGGRGGGGGGGGKI